MRTVNIHGFSFSVESEPKDYWDWIEQGTYHADFETITRFAGPEVTCIDAGAWIGADTLYASKMFKHVHAIEPDPVAFQILSKNLAANQLSNVTLYEHALMGHSGTTTMGGSILGCSCTRETCKDNSVTVPCLTLREFCKDIPDPLFIKMDTEGAEAQILKDWQFFSERKPDLMLSTHLLWWKEAGSDGRAEYEPITKVGKLYRSAVHNGSRTPVDFNTEYGDVVFTDKE
jgi:FkbM family methyltransferase